MADHTFDMGDQGCGEMAMSLRRAMQDLAPGDCMTVLSRDLGAPADVPAWCRLTGHELVSMGECPDARAFEFVVRKG
jgi:TusA-related sulfurtransferase